MATPLPNAGTEDPKSSAGPDLDAVDKEISKQVEKDIIENDEKITSNNLSTPTTKGVSFNVTEPTPLDTPTSTGQATPPRKSSRSSRRVSLPLNRMTSILTIESFDNVATPFDFAAILKILEELYRIVPLSAMISGVPMLLALDADAGNELIRRPGDGRNGAWVLERRRAIKETVVFAWKKLGQQWKLDQIGDLANRVRRYILILLGFRVRADKRRLTECQNHGLYPFINLLQNSQSSHHQIKHVLSSLMR
jgi:hypothetical protein